MSLLQQRTFPPIRVQNRTEINCKGLRTFLEQNPKLMGRFSVTSRRKGNRINRIYGAGDGNRTHVRVDVTKDKVNPKTSLV